MAKVYPENEKSRDRRLQKIATDKSKPAEGDYDVVKAWKKT